MRFLVLLLACKAVLGEPDSTSGLPAQKLRVSVRSSRVCVPMHLTLLFSASNALSEQRRTRWRRGTDSNSRYWFASFRRRSPVPARNQTDESAPFYRAGQASADGARGWRLRFGLQRNRYRGFESVRQSDGGFEPRSRFERMCVRNIWSAALQKPIGTEPNDAFVSQFWKSLAQTLSERRKPLPRVRISPSPPPSPSLFG